MSYACHVSNIQIPVQY